MNSHQPSWERVLAWLVVGAVILQILADVLPRLLVPLAVLGITGGGEPCCAWSFSTPVSGDRIVNKTLDGPTDGTRQ